MRFAFAAFRHADRPTAANYRAFIHRCTAKPCCVVDAPRRAAVTDDFRDTISFGLRVALPGSTAAWL